MNPDKDRPSFASFPLMGYQVPGATVVEPDTSPEERGPEEKQPNAFNRQLLGATVRYVYQHELAASLLHVYRLFLPDSLTRHKQQSLLFCRSRIANSFGVADCWKTGVKFQRNEIRHAGITDIRKASGVDAAEEQPEFDIVAMAANIVSKQYELKSQATKALYLVRAIGKPNYNLRILQEQLEQIVGPQEGSAAAPPGTVEIASPLRGALQRGQQYIAAEYKKPENLTLEDASLLAACSDRVLNERRQAGKVYALLPPAKARGFRYPKWQFDVVPERLEAALAPFFASKTNTWVVHHFMFRPNESLGGMTPSDYLLDPEKPLNKVIEAIKESLPRDQGAA